MSKVRSLLLMPLVATAMAAVPSALDPLSVAPHMHDLAFENDKVRVLKSTIRNGETPPLHVHPDRVIVYVNSCAWLVEDKDGEKHMESFKFGEPTWAPAETHGGRTSNVIQQCSVIEVELL